MSEFKKFTLLKESGTIATSETISNKPMSELVWEQTKELRLFAGTSSHTDFVIYKHFDSLTEWSLNIISYGEDVHLCSNKDITILKSKAERIYQIIKE
ncbi:MAG: hypothetical protein NTW25_00310 [Candidatus Kapabacteria bacterium]|nr:hypothetical protein [Candidatus Kapabacteria bacterium]